MGKFDDLLEEIKDGIGALAKKEAGEFLAESSKDTTAFLKEIRADVERWAELVAKGKLTPAEFEFLLGAKRDLAKMKALTRRGLAKARIDRIVDGMLAIVSKAVTDLV